MKRFIYLGVVLTLAVSKIHHVHIIVAKYSDEMAKIGNPRRFVIESCIKL